MGGPGPQETGLGLWRGRARVRLRLMPTVRGDSPARRERVLQCYFVWHFCDFPWLLTMNCLGPARVTSPSPTCRCQCTCGSVSERPREPRGEERRQRRRGYFSSFVRNLFGFDRNRNNTYYSYTNKGEVCSSISMFYCSPKMFNFKFRHLIKWRSSSPFMFYV